jgi:hypothetical protein
METSLDCIQKLIAHGYITNDKNNMEIKQQLINRITRVICNCFEGPHIDDAVQLQIIKVGKTKQEKESKLEILISTEIASILIFERTDPKVR